MANGVNIVDGKVQSTYTDTYQKENTVGTSALGKDAFLQLLVTQLQYQDPLSPQSNEEFVSQLAQFSSLEEMQAMTSSLANSQALSLVGKNVIIEVGKSKDLSNTSFVAGYVQFDQLYEYEDLDSVIDDYYLEKEYGK